MLTIEYKQVHYEGEGKNEWKPSPFVDNKEQNSSSKHTFRWRTSSPVKCIHFLPFQLYCPNRKKKTDQTDSSFTYTFQICQHPTRTIFVEHALHFVRAYHRENIVVMVGYCVSTKVIHIQVVTHMATSQDMTLMRINLNNIFLIYSFIPQFVRQY